MRNNMLLKHIYAPLRTYKAYPAEEPITALIEEREAFTFLTSYSSWRCTANEIKLIVAQ